MRAIQISRNGGPEVLEMVDLPEPTPGPDQLLVDVAAAGINYADTHIADGSYLSRPELPYVPGSEVIGRTPDGRRPRPTSRSWRWTSAQTPRSTARREVRPRSASPGGTPSA